MVDWDDYELISSHIHSRITITYKIAVTENDLKTSGTHVYLWWIRYDIWHN